MYYLWNVAGGDIEAEFAKRGYVTFEPPILVLERFASMFLLLILKLARHHLFSWVIEWCSKG